MLPGSFRSSMCLLVALLPAVVGCTSSEIEARQALASETVASAEPARHVAATGERPCPAPVCRYEGTAWEEMIFGRDEPGSEFRVRGDATVAWIYSHRDGRDAIYVATGEVQAQWTNENCTITLSPSVHAFAPPSNESSLRVDFSTNPVTYSGSGFAKWDAVQHWSCRPDTEWTDPDGGSHAGWFDGGGSAGRGGVGLEGSSETPDRRSGWSFRAVF